MSLLDREAQYTRRCTGAGLRTWAWGVEGYVRISNARGKTTCGGAGAGNERGEIEIINFRFAMWVSFEYVME